MKAQDKVQHPADSSSKMKNMSWPIEPSEIQQTLEDKATMEKMSNQVNKLSNEDEQKLARV